MEREKAWSEGRGQTEDVMFGLGAGADIDVAVQDMPVKTGVILIADCTRCGRQNKSIIDWGEISIWEMKRTRPADAPPNHPQWDLNIERPTRQGLIVSIRCNGSMCGTKPFPVMIAWTELRDWIDVGVQSGCLKRQIYDLSRRR